MKTAKPRRKSKLPPTPETLRVAGEALFGTTWQSELARHLGLCDSRRVRAWLKEERSIPEDLWPSIEKLIESRIMTLRDVAERLPHVSAD